MVKNLIIINVVLFLLKLVVSSMGIDLDRMLGLNYNLPTFKWYQFISYMFMHGDFMHLLFNMFALWMFGAAIENAVGPKRFLIFYLICGLGAAALHIGALHLMHSDPRSIMVGASGSVFGLLFAFGYLFPNSMIYIYFLFPIKAKYFVAIYAAIELWMGLKNSVGDNVAHFAHLGGMVIAFILLKYWKVNRRLY